MRHGRGKLGLAISLALAGCYASTPVEHDGDDAAHVDDGVGDDAAEPRCTENPDTAAAVGLVATVSAPTDGFIRVTFVDGTVLLLDEDARSTAVWVDIIASCMERDAPVYLEYTRATAVVVELDLPRALRVLTITDTEDGVELTMMVSAAIHRLLRSYPCYELFLARLRQALEDGTSVLVTERSVPDRIIDVRPAP